MREADLVSKIMKAVKAKYPRAYVVKLADRYRRGLPDLLILYSSLPPADSLDSALFVEVKMPNGILSKIQQAEHKAIQQAGGDVLVATSVVQVLLALETRRAMP